MDNRIYLVNVRITSKKAKFSNFMIKKADCYDISPDYFYLTGVRLWDKITRRERTTNYLHPIMKIPKYSIRMKI